MVAQVRDPGTGLPTALPRELFPTAERAEDAEGNDSTDLWTGDDTRPGKRYVQ